MKTPFHILILEDFPSDAYLMVKELESARIDFEYRVVDTLEAFSETLRTFKPDIVLSDYCLPQFTGMDALSLLAKSHPYLPFIIVTGAINEETAVDLMKAGAWDYVLKDRLGRLSTAVKSAIEKRRTVEEKTSAEEALVASETRYRRLFEMAREGIILLDGEKKTIKDANPYLCHLLETDFDSIQNKKIYEIGLFSKQSSYEEAFHNFNENQYLHLDRLEITTPSGKEFVTEMICNSYPVDGRLAIQCNVRDISERIEAERENRKIQAQLFQAQKMEAIGTLAGGVAHDFNNLMTAIQVSADVAMMKVDEDDTIYVDMKEIRSAALRAAKLIRQLLLFSREHPMELVPVSLNPVIENLLKMLMRLIGEDIQIETNLDPELWTVRSDSVNLEQVIMNLTLNARDAMPKGGMIFIRTKNIVVDEDLCKAMAEARAGKFVCLSLADTGIGMDARTIDRIFEPFFTTKATGKGSGLGLSVVYGIVKQHEGWIQVQSDPGHGSTFNIYLPAIPDEPSDVREGPTLAMIQGKGERILLVEDEDKVREFTGKALSKCGYSIVTSMNVADALKTFQDYAGEFDLVFSDVVLSDQTGIDLVEMLVQLKPSLKVLLSSGYMDHKLQWPVILERGYKFLQKPYALPELLKILRECLD